jgi:hypothetical protein
MSTVKEIKKKTATFICTFFVCAISLSAQNLQLKKYYKYINQAELAICKENYRKAGIYYQKAFSYHTPFSINVFHAFKIHAKYAYNMEAALKCIHISMQRSTFSKEEELEYIANYFDTLQHNELWQHIKVVIDTTKVTIIPELQQQIDSIAEKDQEVRRKCNKDFETYCNVDTSNLAKVKLLYQQYGSINENMACIHMINTCILHNRVYETDPADILLTEVLSGCFRADLYMYLCDRYALDVLKTLPKYACFESAQIVNGTLFIFEPQNLKQVNQNRKRLGISETWQNYRKKMIYEYQHPQTDFYFQTLYNYVYDDDNALVAQWKDEIDSKKIKGAYYERENKK